MSSSSRGSSRRSRATGRCTTRSSSSPRPGQITEALEAARAGGRFEIIEPPTRPVAPVAPDKLMILALSLLAGVVVGFGIVLATEQSDTSFKDIEEIERALDLPVLATVPDADVFRAVAAREKALRRQGARGRRPATRRSSSTSFARRPSRSSSGAWRSKLAKKFHGEIPKAILVTSSHRGEGKTTSAACLAITLAKHYGKKTVLVDCDLRKPRTHLLMEVPSAPGHLRRSRARACPGHRHHGHRASRTCSSFRAARSATGRRGSSSRFPARA